MMMRNKAKPIDQKRDLSRSPRHYFNLRKTNLASSTTRWRRRRASRGLPWGGWSRGRCRPWSASPKARTACTRARARRARTWRPTRASGSSASRQRKATAGAAPARWWTQCHVGSDASPTHAMWAPHGTLRLLVSSLWSAPVPEPQSCIHLLVLKDCLLTHILHAINN